jgi:hypothetical protein
MPWSIGLGQPAVEHRQNDWKGNAMLPLDSYRELLSERARGHHVIASAWFVLVAVAVFLIAMA